MNDAANIEEIQVFHFLQTLFLFSHLMIRLSTPLLQRMCVFTYVYMCNPIQLVLIINDRQCNEVP